MASRYFRNTGNTSWNVTTNWSATSGGASVGALPVAGDDIHFDANSGNCVVNQASPVGGSIDFTGYVGTITMNNAIVLSLLAAANITLSSGMTVAGTAGLTINSPAGATSQLTSNGKIWPNTLTLNGSGSPTFNFVDSWTMGALTLGGGAKTITGSNINVTGNLAVNISTTLSGVTITMTGTGTWSATAVLIGNLTFNTAGTITIGSSVTFQTGTLKYIAGTIDTTTNSSTLILQNDCTLDTTSTVVWNNITSNSAVTITINSILRANGTFTLSNNNKTFAGTAGFNVDSLVDQATTSNNRNFATGNMYRVRTLLQAISTNPLAHPTYKSSTGGTQALFQLDTGASCQLGYVDFTDIDASNGRVINTFNGVLSNTKKIKSYQDPTRTLALSFAA